MRVEQLLAFKILEQAIFDYKYLKKSKRTRAYDKGGAYSIKDIERFLSGNWSTRLLEMMDSKLTGSDILNRIKAQCA